MISILANIISKKLNEIDFLEVLPRLLPKIHALALHFASPDEQDDLVQEGLISLFECTQSFDPSRGVPFDGFAMTCIRRRMISALRKNSAVRSFDMEEWQSLPDLVSTAPTPEDYALGRESVERFHSIIKNHLSLMESNVLALHLDGLSYREIARQIGKTEKSVENALSRIRTKIAKQLTVA